MRLNVFYFLLLTLFFAACEKEELPIEKKDRGDVITAEVFIEDDYRYQIWYDLENNVEVKKSLKTDWDLAFSCSDSSSDIYINGGISMQAANTGSKDLSANYDPNSLNFKGENVNGYFDSLALKNWQSGNVFVIDKGYSTDFTSRGQVKVQFISLEKGVYTFKYKGEDGIEKEVQLTKDAKYNRIGFSFDTETVVEFEPAKDSYDFCFTQYSQIFFEPDYLPYTVTGVLINNSAVSAYAEKELAFSEITAESIKESAFTSTRDIIGYDWKTIDINLANPIYEIDLSQNFIIKTRNGFLFKLHFIDFYNSQGAKGNFVFEYQRL